MDHFFRLFCFGLLSIACSCTSSPSESSDAVENKIITKAELIQMKKEHSDLIILDVRTAEEVAEGMVPGATNMDFYAANFDRAILTLNKEAPIVVYCRSGGRSGKTRTKLEEAGYTNVYDFQAYDRWTETEE